MFRKKIEEFDEIINKIEILSNEQNEVNSVVSYILKDFVRQLDKVCGEIEEDFIHYENRIEDLEERLDYYLNPEDYNEF